jgi:DNA-binding IclR family transcriptional regulator
MSALPDRTGQTSLEKALEICDALSGAQRGMSVTELARALRLPPSTVHRYLTLLRRQGYVRQAEDTSRYFLTLKMLDLSFRLLGRSELRLHAYPVLRGYALRTGNRSFIANPAAGEVTYIWSTGPDAVAMHTTYGKEMPGHCSIYFDASQARRLSCLRLVRKEDVAESESVVRGFGAAPREGDGLQRLMCTCAPVYDYTSREVARVGLFGHGADPARLTRDYSREAWELARLISMRLGHLSGSALEVTA